MTSITVDLLFNTVVKKLAECRLVEFTVNGVDDNDELDEPDDCARGDGRDGATRRVTGLGT